MDFIIPYFMIIMCMNFKNQISEISIMASCNEVLSILHVVIVFQQNNG